MKSVYFEFLVAVVATFTLNINAQQYQPQPQIQQQQQNVQQLNQYQPPLLQQNQPMQYQPQQQYQQPNQQQQQYQPLPQNLPKQPRVPSEPIGVDQSKLLGSMLPSGQFAPGQDNRIKKENYQMYGWGDKYGSWNNPYPSNWQGYQYGPGYLDVCASTPCYNGGRCTPNGAMRFTCSCTFGWYGVICETRDFGALLGVVLGTILPFVALCAIAALVYIFYCQPNRRRNLRK